MPVGVSEGFLPAEPRLFCIHAVLRAMEHNDLQQELKDQLSHALSRQHLFQSDWDIISFAVFFIFIGE